MTTGSPRDPKQRISSMTTEATRGRVAMPSVCWTLAVRSTTNHGMNGSLHAADACPAKLRA